MWARRQTEAHHGELATPNRRIAWEKPYDSDAWVEPWTRAGAACLQSETWPDPVKQEKVANVNLPRLGGAAHVASTRARYTTSVLSLRARSRSRRACTVQETLVFTMHYAHRATVHICGSYTCRTPVCEHIHVVVVGWNRDLLGGAPLVVLLYELPIQTHLGHAAFVALSTIIHVQHPFVFRTFRTSLMSCLLYTSPSPRDA